MEQILDTLQLDGDDGDGSNALRENSWANMDIMVILQPRRWRQYISLKRWYLPTSLHGVITQKNIIVILTAVRTSNLIQYFTS
jgi:hypothetical protein